MSRREGDMERGRDWFGAREDLGEERERKREKDGSIDTDGETEAGTRTGETSARLSGMGLPGELDTRIPGVKSVCSK